MSAPTHAYKDGRKGRRLSTRAGVGGVTITAHLGCARCEKVGGLNLRAIMPPEQIDQKFMQHGWSVDPHRCPDCRAAIAKEKTMSKPVSTAIHMKAQVLMIQRIYEHFDTEKGRYDVGWSDKKIADESNLSEATVAQFRVAGFGELKEPEALRSIRADLDAVEQLARESFGSINEQVAAIRGQLAKIPLQ